MKQLETFEAWEDQVVAAIHSVYDEVEFESRTEREFVRLPS